MHPFPTRVLVACLACLGTGPVVADGGSPPPAAPRPVTAAERDAAVAKGVRYLERTVFGLPEAAGTPRKPFTVAVVGLVDLLDRAEETTTRRRATGLRDRARKYLDAYVSEVGRRAADPTQLAETSDVSSSAHLMQVTWPLGMAGLFYGELHARGLGTADAARTLRRIVDVLAVAQAPNGGWGHAPVRGRGRPRGPSEMDGFGGYPDTLLASTSLVASCLALVRPVAPPTQDDLFDRARAYFEYAELANGNFPYDPSQRAAHLDMTGVSRAAGAALALHLLGVDWRDVGLARALEMIDENFEYLSEGHGSSTFNLLLAALLQRRRGPEAWGRFKETYFRRLLDGQAGDGSFACICLGKAFGSTNDSRPPGGAPQGALAFFANYTDTYVSAIHTLILLLDRAPLRLLPDAPPEGAPGPTTPR